MYAVIHFDDVEYLHTNAKVERDIMRNGLLSEEQIENGYFASGLSHNDNLDPHVNKSLTEISEWDGKEYVCIFCTQLYPPEVEQYFGGIKGYTTREQKRIKAEWVDFLRTNTKALKGVHFRSCLHQDLLEAVCFQEKLETLRIKWGSFSDWTCLENLKTLKYFSSDGNYSKVSDVSPISKLEELVVLDLVDYKKVKDLSPFANLKNLEQLRFAADCKIKDLEFLRQMPNLRDLRISVKLEKNYTLNEIDSLITSLPNLRDSYDFFAELKRKIKGE